MNDQDLGRVRGTFKPAYGNVIAGFIIGALLIGGGGAVVGIAVNGAIENHGRLPLWVEKGWCWGAVGLLSALGIGLMVGGVFLVQWMRSAISMRIKLGTHGLGLTRKGETRYYAWSDIVSVRETHLYEPVVSKGVLKHALPRRMSEVFVVNFNDGEPLVLDVNSIGAHAMLARMIKKDTDRLDIPWEIVEEHV